MGFIARILAVVRTRRLRELNTLMAKKTGYRLTVVNLSDKKGRRVKCVFQPEIMLVADDTKSKFTSNLHRKKKIVQECERFGGDIHLHQLQNELVNQDAFLKARELFNQEEQDYSNVINIKDFKGLYKRSKPSKIYSEEESEAEVDVASEITKKNKKSTSPTKSKRKKLTSVVTAKKGTKQKATDPKKGRNRLVACFLSFFSISFSFQLLFLLFLYLL